MKQLLRWRWQLWRARHWEWRAYMDWYHGQGDWETYEHVRKQAQQVYLSPPRR